MDGLDLAAYLRRIGFEGTPPAADLATLEAIVARHRSAIAFENVGALAGRVPSLETAALQARLVDERRGGWCFEQNHLLRAALQQLGFDVLALEGRVRIGAVAESDVTARTHMALSVGLGGRRWLVDVGFGGLTPAGPLAFDEAGVQVRRGQSYRIATTPTDERHNVGRWTLQGVTDGHWHDFYRLHAEPANAVDFTVSNWYTATCPNAMLRRNLVVSRPLPDGTRVALLNDRLTVRRGGDGPPERRFLAGRAEFIDALADLFDLVVDDAELDAALRVVEQAAGPAVTMTGLS
jgi:N-hydroxyarylamine O-acetyltransferase